MHTANANGVELCYETFGTPDDPAMLLIMGLGAQMIAWPERLCEMLAEGGYHVIRYDNRDVGLSTKFSDHPPDLANPAYSLEDMAADATGLLDALGIERAHIVGVSMGGMIAQLVAIRYPDRVLSLASIMSNHGGPDVVPPTPEAMAVLMAPRPTTREEVIEFTVRGRKVIGSRGYLVDEEYYRQLAGRAYDRCYHPQGLMRQLAAVTAAPSRVEELRAVGVPTVVIHGTDDPLVPPENGRRTAEAIPGAELVLVEGMGHDLPQGAWETLAGAITRNAARAAASR